MQRRSLLKAAAAAPLLSGLAMPAVGQNSRASTLRFVPQANLAALDPIWTTATVTGNHGYYVFDTLYALNAAGQPRPQMAEGHEVLEDGKLWRIRLRPGLKFHDEIETVNKYAKELDRQGVKSIVALIHEGGMPASGSYNYNCDSPGAGDGISGPIVDIAKGITPKVDALVTGHTHQAYVCDIPDPSGKPRMVTSAASFGRS